VLIKRGQLAPGHHSIIRRVKADMEPARVKLMMVDNKRAVKGPDIDCASLLHLCHARCCSLQVKLSEEDIAGGRLRWNLDEPYILRQNPDHGYCENLQPNGGCGVYEDRPAACRAYDCRKDTRVWEDFEKKIPAATPYWIVPLGEWGKPREPSDTPATEAPDVADEPTEP
jgi:Fe-S-cluster containining protein